MEARLSQGFNPEIDGEDVVQMCIHELSGEPFDSVTILPFEVGDLGVVDDGRGPSQTAALGALSHWRCRARRRKDGGSAWNSANHWDFKWRSAICPSTRDIESRESRSRASELGCDSMRRTRSFLSTTRAVSDLDPVSGLESERWSSKQSCNQPQHVGGSSDIAARDAIVEARRLPGLGTRSRNPANVTRRAAVSGVRAVPRPSTAPQFAPPGLESNLGRVAMALESRKEPGRRLDNRQRAGARWPWRSMRAPCRGDRDVVAYHSDERETHPEVIIHHHEKRVKEEMRVLAGEAWSALVKTAFCSLECIALKHLQRGGLPTGSRALVLTAHSAASRYAAPASRSRQEAAKSNCSREIP